MTSVIGVKLTIGTFLTRMPRDVSHVTVWWRVVLATDPAVTQRQEPVTVNKMWRDRGVTDASLVIFTLIWTMILAAPHVSVMDTQPSVTWPADTLRV